MYTDYHHYWWLDKVKPGDKVVCIYGDDIPKEKIERINLEWYLPNGNIAIDKIYMIKDIRSSGPIKYVAIDGFPVIHVKTGIECGFSPACLRPLLPNELKEQLDEIESTIEQECYVQVC